MKNLRLGSLAFRFLASILGITVLVLLLAMSLLQVQARQSSERQTEIARDALGVERQESERLLSRALETKAELLGRFMARTAPDVLLTFDLDLIGRYQREAASDPDIAYALYLDADGETMTETQDRPKDAIESRYPVEADGDLLGYVLIGLDPSRMVAAKRIANARIAEAIEGANRLSKTSQTQFLTTLALVSIGLVTLLGLLFGYMFLRQVIRPIKDTTTLIERLAHGEGDLSQRLPVSGDSEIDRLRQAMNHFMERLQDMVRTIVHQMQELTLVSGTLNDTAATLVRDMETERSHTQQVTDGVEQMVETIRQVALNSSKAAEAARSGEDKARDGQSIVSSTTQGIRVLSAEVSSSSEVIGRLEDLSGRIGSVLDAINNISARTNLLALNAAIEAARAGEHGRGFAVVAGEVRALAGRTQQSTEEVRQIVEQLTQGSQDAASAMGRSLTQAETSVSQSEQANAALEAILAAVGTINAMSDEIASAVEGQAKVAEQVSRQITEIEGLRERTTMTAQQARETSNDLSALATSLDSMVGRFRV
ncbi:methyl-accepting chemotaxis sensory transducer [Thiorhodococcus drewsii AZ1]|uniref:Methyl-accepting chemotaxis sensory transducer n=1 Tax=Thiorhodococcus drewsii AZ1 TaxID=765913 RepID=G2E5I4_9GAMM|nr:methyl-accepting chemotaxis protein [Thiorhodococcus drewsii]EGV28653.1 methyl-accepting chemotaxis sensory transducer [Thiorhodococcus drewsii AZ1]